MKRGIRDLLGEHWNPVPSSWRWSKIDSDAGVLHILIVETPLGRTGLAFTPDDVAELVRTAQEATSGLTLPTNGLVKP